MNTSHSRRISRNAAELLLDGHAGPDPDQLTQVLAAATAPARDSELSGEQMAVAAFEANHLVPVATSHREHKSMLARLLTVKVLVTSLAAVASGGVALAASTGALTTSGSSHVTATASALPSATPSASASGQPSTFPSPQSGKSASTQSGGLGTQPGAGTAPSTGTKAQPSASASPSASSLPQGAAALCKTLAGDVTSVAGSTLSTTGLEQALSSSKVTSLLNDPEFSSLVATADSVTNVPDYCALLLDPPQLPQPSDLAQLPSTLLGQLLTALPTSTLAQVLTSLPSATLAQVLTALPTSALSTVLTELPASTVSQLLNEVPAATLAQLPSSVLSQLPTSVISQLPSSVVSGLGL